MARHSQAIGNGAADLFPGGAGSQIRRVPARLLSQVLSRLAAGRVTVHTPSGDRVEYQAALPGPSAVLIMHNWRTIRRLVSNGGIGFAEAYMEEDWSTPDLTALLSLAAANVDSLESTMGGKSWLRALGRLRHARSANTRRGSRRNIAAHYDLGNDFYAAWLDGGMSYSAAHFPSPDCPLEEAQTAKQDRVIEKLELSGAERVLEIGIGWGGLAERMLSQGAARVTGLTLSAEQLRFAAGRIASAGLQGRADLRLQDYRDATGLFDRVVSIEMLEAVGQRYWATYFATLKARLAEKGVAVIQVITIARERFDDYQRCVDFIQRYIFPGGMLPTDQIVRSEIAAHGMTLRSCETFGQSYAWTLAEWRRRFLEAWPSIQALGFDARFRRMWEYYLSYCEAGFKAGVLDVGLYTFSHAPAQSAGA